MTAFLLFAGSPVPAAVSEGTAGTAGVSGISETTEITENTEKLEDKLSYEELSLCKTINNILTAAQ